jgi:hypothetical protein
LEKVGAADVEAAGVVAEGGGAAGAEAAGGAAGGGKAVGVKPRIFMENPNPCTIAIVPGSVAIAYRTSHR